MRGSMTAGTAVQSPTGANVDRLRTTGFTPEAEIAPGEFGVAIATVSS